MNSHSTALIISARTSVLVSCKLQSHLNMNRPATNAMQRRICHRQWNSRPIRVSHSSVQLSAATLTNGELQSYEQSEHPQRLVPIWSCLRFS